MHLLLTDRLCCPRCGPGFGLILLADRVENRRVLRGALGCPNCRERYPVEDGYGDLRAPPRIPFGEPDDEIGPNNEPNSEGATRLAALLGVVRGPGNVALVGGPARHAHAVAGMVDGLEVVAVADEARIWREADGVSRIAAAAGLPFHDVSMRAAALGAETADSLVPEAARAVVPGGRVVIFQASAGARRALEEAGLEVLVDEAGIVVARKL